MSDVHLKFIDRVHIKILSEASTIMELADAFTWKADGYKFNPKYKARLWDGNISLINRMSGTCYAGLAQRIKKFCDARGYSFSFDDELLSDKSIYLRWCSTSLEQLSSVFFKTGVFLPF